VRLDAHHNRPLPKWVVVVAGTVHLILLCAPLLVMGNVRSSAGNPRILMFLYVASTWFVLESLVSESDSHPPATATGPWWLPLSIGIGVGISFPTCQVCLPEMKRSTVRVTPATSHSSTGTPRNGGARLTTRVNRCTLSAERHTRATPRPPSGDRPEVSARS
jgi:hypothetical protein